MTNAQAVSPSLDIIRSDLKAWEPAAKSSQAALQQITAAKQRRLKQSHQSSRPLQPPSLHRGPALAGESRSSPTVPVQLHQLTPVRPHHLIPQTDGTRSHGYRARTGAGRVIFGPTEGAWVGAWVRRRHGDERMCVVGRVCKQAAVHLHRGLLRLRSDPARRRFRGCPQPGSALQCLPSPREAWGHQGNLLCWAGALQPRKAPCPSSPYWENWGLQTGSSHPSWDCDASPAGEKTQKPHRETPHLGKMTLPKGHARFFSLPSVPSFQGDTRRVTGPRKSNGAVLRDLSHPGRAAASPHPHPGGFLLQSKARTRPRWQLTGNIAQITHQRSPWGSQASA